MHYILLVLICLIMGPLQAERAGDVEFRLPKKIKSWENQSYKTEEKITHLNGDTIHAKVKASLYYPSKKSKNKENFTTLVISPSIDLNDEEALQLAVDNFLLQKHGVIEDDKLFVNEWKLDSQSVLYKWSLRISEKEKVHGLTRIFSSEKSTTVLNYETKNAKNFKKQGPMWVKMLKKAKLVN